MSTSAVKRFTVDEYLALERAAETKSEFFDGEIFAMAGGTEQHALLSQNLTRRLGNALEGRPCRVYGSDMRVKAPTGLYTYPDVSVVCGSPEFEGTKRDVLLNPLVIVEVLSPSTEAYDRGKKFDHYRRISSLQAYVMAAQDRKSIEHFARQNNGAWLMTAVNDGLIAIPSLDLTLAVDAVYAQVELP